MSKQHSTLLPQTATMSNDSTVKFRSFDKVKTNWTWSICFYIVERTKFRSTLLPKPATLLPKRQQCRSNIRHCRKNRSTCSIRQCCFDTVAGVDRRVSVVERRIVCSFFVFMYSPSFFLNNHVDQVINSIQNTRQHCSIRLAFSNMQSRISDFAPTRPQFKREETRRLTSLRTVHIHSQTSYYD